MIAVCLISCGRTLMTRRTVASFVEHHKGRSDLTLLHSDGGCEGADMNTEIAREAGFQTVSNGKRIDFVTSMRQFIDATDAEWIYWFENDWEFVNELPPYKWCLTVNHRDQIDTVRLFHKFKMREGPKDACSERRLGTEEQIEWSPYSPLPHDLEIGRAHWAGGGSLIRRGILKRHRDAKRVKDVILAENNLLTLRFIENRAWHIGTERTPGFTG